MTNNSPDHLYVVRTYDSDAFIYTADELAGAMATKILDPSRIDDVSHWEWDGTSWVVD